MVGVPGADHAAVLVLLHVQLVDLAEQVLQLRRQQHLGEDVRRVLLGVDAEELDPRLLEEEEADLR
eukprot:15163083-Alexandrium_andersonii.AAC.1